MNITANTISSIGLMLDIIGVLFLFIYGLPSKFEEVPGRSKGETSAEEKIRLKKNNSIKIKAHIGLLFIIIGFIFQLLSNLFNK